MNKHTKTVLIILGAAAALRAVLLVQIHDLFLFQTPILDAKYYAEWAREIAAGDWLGRARGVFMMSPGYSYAMALVMKVLGTSITTIVIVQFILSLLTGTMVYLLAKHFFTPTTGLWAASLYLFYAPGMFYETTLLKATLLNFCNTGFLLALTGSGIVYALIAGILLGISIQLRPNALVLSALALIFLYIKHSNRKRAIILFFAGLLAVLAPVAIRTYAISHEFAFSTAHGGMNFFTGNSKYCLGPYTPMPFARTDPEVEQKDFMLEASRRAGRMLSEKESSSFWYRESIKYITGHPAEWCLLTAKKALIFLNAYEPPINLDYYFFRSEFRSVLAWPLPHFGIIFPLAIVGIIGLPFNLLLGGYALIYAALSIAFFVVSEYRFPLVPVLAIFAGFAMERFTARVNPHATPNRTALIIVLVLAGLLSNSDIYTSLFGFTTYKKANLANSYFGMGVTYEDHGMIPEAIAAYEKALQIMPQNAPLTNLASVLERQGQRAKAQALYEQALTHNMRSAEIYNNLGAIYFKNNDLVKADQCFTEALAMKPDLAQALANRAIVRGRHAR